MNLRNRRFRTQLDADQTIDLLNNQIGRSLGNTAPIGMRDMALRVLEVFYRDGLYTANRVKTAVGILTEQRLHKSNTTV